MTALALICSLLQAALAGMFVTGDVDMLEMHAMNSGLVILFVLGQMVTSVLLWRRDRAQKWPMAAAALLLCMVGTQQVLGDERVIAWHILLGTAIVGANAAMVCWAFTLRVDRASARVPEGGRS